MLVSVKLDRHARWQCHFVERTNMSVEIKGIVMGFRRFVRWEGYLS